MTRTAYYLTRRRDLLFARARVVGPAGSVVTHLLLDTGALVTTLTPEVIQRLGYTRRDGYQAASIRTAVGVEHGYSLRVAKFDALGIWTPNFALQVFPLGHDIDGLIGMNFLRHFNFEVRPEELVILTELISSARR